MKTGHDCLKTGKGREAVDIKDRRMKKKIIAAAVILIVLAAAVAGSLWANRAFFKKTDMGKDETGGAGENAGIPSLAASCEGETLCVLTGYAMPMNDELLRDSLIAASEDERKVVFSFSSAKNAPSSVAYEVRSDGGSRLVDSGSVRDFSKEGDDVSFTLSLSAIMEEGREYFLSLAADMPDRGNVYYYSRLTVAGSGVLKAQIAFAKKFSDSTMDSREALNLTQYMEPDESLQNNHLGHVTLNNNFDLLTWGNLSPEKITDTSVCLKEVCVKDTGVSGTYQMTYRISATEADDIKRTYDVTETIVVWTFDSRQYVLSYDREMEQIWEPDRVTVRESFIDLGIQKDTDAEFVQSPDGRYVAFVAAGSLWLGDLETGGFSKMYEPDTAFFGKTFPRLCLADNDGNVYFIICGCCGKPPRAGMNGFSVRRYGMKENTVKELLFIPYDIPGDLMIRDARKFCYLKDDVLYLMLGGDIHYFNVNTKETGLTAENLSGGDYAVNASGDRIAYNTGGSAFESDSVTVMDLSSGVLKTVPAGKGNLIKVCGYSGNNLVCGIAPEKKIDKNKNLFPMSSIIILDPDLNEAASYSRKNIYITSVEIDGEVIRLKRTGPGGKAAEDDRLLSNMDEEAVNAKAGHYDDNMKYRETAISLSETRPDPSKIRILPEAKEEFAAPVIQVKSKTADQTWYVYAAGKLYGVYTDRAEAEQNAKEQNGLVTGSGGEKLWTFEENYD